MIPCSAKVAKDCLGTTDEVYRLTVTFRLDNHRGPFGMCINCTDAATRLGMPFERVHGYAARAIAQNMPTLVVGGVAA